MIDRAQRRLLWALGASALLHVWVVESGEGSHARRAANAASRISATLSVPPQAPASQRPMVREAAEVAQSAPVPMTASPSRVSAEAAQASRVQPVSNLPMTRMAEVAAAPTTPPALPGDPTYYSARSLDVYPKAQTTLTLNTQSGAGKVRATVLIDETGTVNDVRAIQADAAELENAARELLLSTRFTPAAKDGRIVKAQVLVSLEYGATSK